MTTRTNILQFRDMPDDSALSAQEASRISVTGAVGRSNVLLNCVRRALWLPVVQGDVVELQSAKSRVSFPLSRLLTGVYARADASHYAYLHRGRERER